MTDILVLGAEIELLSPRYPRFNITGKPLTSYLPMTLTDDQIQELAERYPLDPWDELIEDFPYTNKESLQQKASRLRKNGYDIGYRKIRDRAQFDQRPKLDLTKCERVDLARMIDTDGWISSTSNRSVRIGFSNKNKELMSHFEKLAQLSTRDNGRKRASERARTWQTAVHGLVEVYSVLEAVVDELIAKHERAKITMEFVESRCETLKNSTYHDGKIRMTKEQKELISKLGEANKLGE